MYKQCGKIPSWYQSSKESGSNRFGSITTKAGTNGNKVEIKEIKFEVVKEMVLMLAINLI